MRIEVNLADVPEHVSELSAQDAQSILKTQPLSNRSSLPLNSRGTRRGMNLNSRRNLSLTPVHEHGYREDRAKKSGITECVRKMLDDPCPYDLTKTWREYLAYQWLERAVDNSTFFKELMERLEGRTVQPVSMPEGLEVRQKIEIISAGDIQPALSALIACGAVQVNQN